MRSCVACLGSKVPMISVVKSFYEVLSLSSCKWPFCAGIASLEYKTLVGFGSWSMMALSLILVSILLWFVICFRKM